MFIDKDIWELFLDKREGRNVDANVFRRKERYRGGGDR